MRFARSMRRLRLPRYAISTRTPAPRSACSTSIATGSTPSPTGTTATGGGASGTASSSIDSRSIPAAQPIAGVGGPPMAATSPS